MRGNDPVPGAPKNFYQVLGVSETATTDEIKKAYRRLAKKYHPDVTGGDKAKEAKFKEFSEAYETIGDEKKRAEYDARRKNPFAGMGGGGGGGFPGGSPFPGGFPGGGPGGQRVHIDLDELFRNRGGGARGAGTRTEEPRESFGDIFSDLFSGMGFGGGAAQAARDVTMQAEVDFLVAALGGDIQVQTPGGRWNVRIPAGIEEGQTVRVAGKGEPGHGKRPAGDLLIEVKVKPHPHFRRKGHDVEVDVPVPVETAILGGKIEVPTLEGGKGHLSIAAGTSSGLKLRIKGKGIPQRGTSQRGDLYAVVQIAVPKEIPQKARELIEEFARLTRK